MEMLERTDVDWGSQPRCVVVYDGECPFCRKQIARIRRWDRAEQLEYVPRRSPGLEERFPKLAEGDFNTGMRFVAPDGLIHVGADAVYQIAARLPFWRRLAWLYRVPGLHRLARAAYAWIAAHRMSLGSSCEEGVCRTQRR